MLYFLPFSFPSICLVSIIVCSGANPARSSATRPGGRRGELHLQFTLRLQSGTALAQNTHHHEIYITGTNIASFSLLPLLFFSFRLCFNPLPSALSVLPPASSLLFFYVSPCTSFPPPARQELFEERRRGKTTSVSSVDQNEVVNNLFPSPSTSDN